MRVLKIWRRIWWPGPVSRRHTNRSRLVRKRAALSADIGNAHLAAPMLSFCRDRACWQSYVFHESGLDTCFETQKVLVKYLQLFNWHHSRLLTQGIWGYLTCGSYRTMYLTISGSHKSSQKYVQVKPTRSDWGKTQLSIKPPTRSWTFITHLSMTHRLICCTGMEYPDTNNHCLTR